MACQGLILEHYTKINNKLYHAEQSRFHIGTAGEGPNQEDYVRVGCGHKHPRSRVLFYFSISR